jgi:predicted DNA-binding ribbon-helix-helix protein
LTNSLHGSVAEFDDVQVARPRYGLRREAIMGDRTFIVAGRRIRIALEEQFWECLEDLASEQDLPLRNLVEMIGQRFPLEVASALRLYVLDDVLQKAGYTLTATPAPCEPSLKYH